MIAVTEHYMLPGAVATWMVFAILLAAVAAWAGSHLLSRRLQLWLPSRLGAASYGRSLILATGCFIFRAAVGSAAVLAAVQAALRVVLLTTNWPLWPIAVGAAVGVEVILSLYAFEQGVACGAGPKSLKLKRILPACRVALLLLLAAMLTQPVVSRQQEDSVRRVVAVLVDQSASMMVSDSQMSPGERLRLGEALGQLKRQHGVDRSAVRLEKARADLTAQADWLQSARQAGGDSFHEQLHSRAGQLLEQVNSAVKVVDEEQKAVNELFGGKVTLSGSLRTSLTSVKAALGSQVRENLASAAAILDEKNRGQLASSLDRMTQALQAATAGLADVVPKVSVAAGELDDAQYAALASDQKASVDEAASWVRSQLAHRIISTPLEGLGDKPVGLADHLSSQYQLRLYSYSSDCRESSIQSLGEPELTGDEPSAALQQTDLAAAIRKVLKDVPAGQLAGIVVLTDGRHNAPARLEPLAGQLARGRVPLSSIMIGAAVPPRDAAVISAEAPRSLYLKDKMHVDAHVKLDGLAGQKIRISLLDSSTPGGNGSPETDGGKEVAFKEITPPADVFRAHVELVDEPQATGMHRYRVRVQQVEGEALVDNNTQDLAVSVTDQKTKMLIIEGRPRWEFRYLKNLFADRDKTVKLQYVLFEPDLIAGMPPRPAVHASAAAADDQIEATALPRDEAEWMKFDVILLGDVAPAQLDAGAQRAIRKFVQDRGGTLIVIAGPDHMPQEFVGSEIEALLPVACRPARSASTASAGAPGSMSPGSSGLFRVGLTDAGRESILMRLKTDQPENLKAWEALPPVDWRNTFVTHALDSATVLAYAQPLASGTLAAGSTGPASPDPAGKRDREMAQALVVHQNVPMGQVLYLNFDRTWRLRYRVGDALHHKFWGQVLRWATASKLPAGKTDFVKLGSDKGYYTRDEAIKISARLLQADYSSLMSSDVAVTVHREGREDALQRVSLQHVTGSAGMYAGHLAPMPSGQYVIRLHCPQAQEMLASRGEQDSVELPIVVEDTVSQELVELSSDPGVMSMLASQTGGVVVGPSQAREVLSALGEKELKHVERRQWTLWDSWGLLALFAGAASAEWLARKKVGLP